MGPMPHRVVDAKRRLVVPGLVYRRRRVRIGEVGLAGPVQRRRVAVEVGPARATGAERRELEMGRVGVGALEHRVLGVRVRQWRVVASAIGLACLAPRVLDTSTYSACRDENPALCPLAQTNVRGL